MRCLAAIVALALAIALPRSAAADRPDTDHLVYAGMAMAIPSYVGTVALHEGTHAILAKMYGSTVLDMSLVPGRGPGGRFYFGYVTYSPRLTTGKRTVVLLTPKLINVVMLSTYGVLLATDTIPENRYGRLALAVWGTGQWVDLSKDLALFWRRHDINVALETNGFDSFAERLPWRLLHIGLSAAGAYVVAKGYQGVFEDDEPVMVPLFDTSF